MMNKYKNERGLTLVELLATIVIGAMVASLIFGIHIMIQKQYTKQKADIAYILDVTTVAKAITKDIRLAETVVVDDVNNTIELTMPGGTSRKYERVGNVIHRAGGAYISNIDEFEVDEEDVLDVAGNIITRKVTLRILSGNDYNEKEIETEIVLR